MYIMYIMYIIYFILFYFILFFPKHIAMQTVIWPNNMRVYVDEWMSDSNLEWEAMDENMTYFVIDGRDNVHMGCN